MIKKWVFVVCMALAMLQTAWAVELKVVSWNIFMLPPGINKSLQMERAPLIAQQLLGWDADVIILQEAFYKKSCSVLGELLKVKYPHQTDLPRKGFIKQSSGVWIFSKYPILKTDCIQYKKGAGWDKFSKKGAVLVQIEKDGKPIQIVGTHMQSSQKHHEVRFLQMKQMVEELLNRNFNPDVPQILGGDFNVDLYDTLEFNLMVRTLNLQKIQFTGARKYSWDGNENDIGRRFFGVHVSTLDYIVARNLHAQARVRSLEILNAAGTVPAQRKNITFRYLSDHYPVMAIINY